MSERLRRLPPSSPPLDPAIFSHLIESLSMKVNGRPPAPTVVTSDVLSDVSQVFAHCKCFDALSVDYLDHAAISRKQYASQK